MKNLLKISFLAILLVGFYSCSDDDKATQDETARMSVKLVDAPGDYDAVFVDVQDVVIKYNGDDDTEVSIGQVNTGVYDLLELTGGASVLLVNDEIPAGRMSQIRLVLGDNNSIVVNGETQPLSTPSAQQSGLKIQVNEDLEAGIFYEFILDFDVEESIVAQGNGGFSLKPVIRASTVAETGAISGLITPINGQVLITAQNGATEISTYANATGAYVLSGVPDGTYTVTFEADTALNLPILTVENVVVVQGEVTVLEAVNFTP
ncbi:DUF4382 domain-containing protein [Jejudonia soesokkakensis]|uniref:DUF4382 domain-containing protein n=1 Tax=Jejudonia soesokkakensis TaxID=1323432 RepID=A0ABW2MR90_9FLAO